MRYMSLQAALIIVACLATGPAAAVPGDRNGGTGSISRLSAEDILRKYYELIAAGECDGAVRLRPGYRAARCSSIRSLANVKIKMRHPEAAIDREKFSILRLSIELDIEGAEELESFTGYVTLNMTPNGWRIGTDSYKSEVTLYAYVEWLSEQPGYEKLYLDKDFASRQAFDPVETGNQTSAAHVKSNQAGKSALIRPENSANRLQPSQNSKPNNSAQSEIADPTINPGAPTAGTLTATDSPTGRVGEDTPPVSIANLAKDSGFSSEPARYPNAPIRRPTEEDRKFWSQLDPKPKPKELGIKEEVEFAANSDIDDAPPKRKSRRSKAAKSLKVPSNAGANMWAHGGPRTFGSQAIMDACWSRQELRGKAGEKRPNRKGPGSRMGPPSRTRPHIKLGALPDRYWRSIRRVDTGGRKLVALTFDTGEQNNDLAGYDAEIIDYLRREEIRATFYFGGKWMATHPERTLQLIADPLFEMGNHAWTHGNLRVLRGRAVDDQVLYTQAQYELMLEKLQGRNCIQRAGVQEMARIPAQIPTFRYPYGTCSRESLAAVNRHGMPAVQWDVVTGDPGRKQTAKGIASNVLRNVKPGSIVIMHSNGRGWKTGKALPLFIPQLRRKGYKFVTVSELLRAGRPIATKTCYELKPGDNLRYDKIFGIGTGD